MWTKEQVYTCGVNSYQLQCDWGKSFFVYLLMIRYMDGTQTYKENVLKVKIISHFKINYRRRTFVNMVSINIKEARLYLQINTKIQKNENRIGFIFHEFPIM